MGFESGLISDSEDEVALLPAVRAGLPGSVARAALLGPARPGSGCLALDASRIEVVDLTDSVEAMEGNEPDPSDLRETARELASAGPDEFPSPRENSLHTIEPDLRQLPTPEPVIQTQDWLVPLQEPPRDSQPEPLSLNQLVEPSPLSPLPSPRPIEPANRFGNMFPSSEPESFHRFASPRPPESEPLNHFALVLSEEPQVEPPAELSGTPYRALRKRNTNQLHPYTYDRNEYGNLGGVDRSNPASSQYRTTLSSPYDDYEDEEEEEEEDEEEEEESQSIPSSPQLNAPHQPGAPDALRGSPPLPSSPLSFESHSAESDSELFVDRTQIVADISQDQQNQTDFMRVAAQSFKRNGDQSTPVQKYTRHESTGKRQARISDTVKPTRLRSESTTAGRSESARPKKQMRLSYPTGTRPREAREPRPIVRSTGAREPRPTVRPTETRVSRSIGSTQARKSRPTARPASEVRDQRPSSGQSSSRPASRPASSSSRQRPTKRKRFDAALRMLENAHKLSRQAYYSPIIQQEDGSYAVPRRARPHQSEQPPRDHHDVCEPPPAPPHSHAIVSLKPSRPRTFALSTFAGSNTLTLPTSPEPWTGVNNYRDVLETSSKVQVKDAFDLYVAYMVDDEIAQETFDTIYTYFFQVGSELLRQDTLLEDGMRKYILQLCCSALAKINGQMEASRYVMLARAAFCLFALCAGYSQAYSTQFKEIQKLVMQFVVGNVAFVSTSSKLMPDQGSLGREAVAIELLVVMFKLDVWHCQLELYRGDSEVQWQLVFLDAFLKSMLQPKAHGWSYVLRLLTKENLSLGLRSYLDRSLELLRVWKWPADKQVPVPFFNFIARESKYADPNMDALDIPDFVVAGEFEAKPRETAFASFLDLLGFTFKNVGNATDKAILRNRVTPMTVVNWQNPTREMLSGMAQRHAIMLVILRFAESRNVELILNTPKDAHIALKMKALTTWSLLVQIVDDEKCAEWLDWLVQGVHGGESQAQEFFCELHKILLRNPRASRYYSGHEVKPLNYSPRPALLDLIWKSVKQMPLRALKVAFPTLESWFATHKEPMHIYVQVLGRLGTIRMTWAHDNKQEFVSAMLEKFDLSFELVAEQVFACLAKPAWDEEDQRFLAMVRRKFHVNGDRTELAKALMSAERHASMLLESLSVERALDTYERALWERVVLSLRTVCFNKFPALQKSHSDLGPAEEKCKNTIRDYISRDQLQTLEYFLGHKIRTALGAEQPLETLVEELVNCIALEDKTSQAFDVIVNRVFSFYVWCGLKRPRMHKVIPALVEATIRVVNFSDCLEFDPSRFVQSLVQYTQVYISGPPPFDWAPISQFCKLVCHCVRQLWVGGHADKWSLVLAQIQELLMDIESVHGGARSSRVSTLHSYSGEEAALDDFLKLDVPSWGPEMPLKKRIGCLRQGLRDLKGEDLLL